MTDHLRDFTLGLEKYEAVQQRTPPQKKEKEKEKKNRSKKIEMSRIALFTVILFLELKL